MLRQTHCHVSFTRLGISSSNNKLYRLLYIRELNSHVNECAGGNLIWARMSGVVIWCEHEYPGWSFDVSTNVRGGHLMWARMFGVVIWCEHYCPALSKIAWERMFIIIMIIINTLDNWVVLQLLIRSQVTALYRMYMYTCITIMCKVICYGIII